MPYPTSLAMTPTRRPNALTVLTWNVMAQHVVTSGFEDWETRRDAALAWLCRRDADLIALQECVLDQQDDVRASLDGFASACTPIGTLDAGLAEALAERLRGRFPAQGELLSLYRADRFELVEQRTAWLSPTPERPSVGFGNVSPRALLALRLRDTWHARDFWWLNTHIDLRCTEVMAELCVRLADVWLDPSDTAIWCGDFNAGLSTPTGDIIRGGGWHTIATTEDDHRGERVDQIWHRGPLSIESVEVVDAERFTPALSDHDPVIMRLAWR